MQILHGPQNCAQYSGWVHIDLMEHNAVGPRLVNECQSRNTQSNKSLPQHIEDINQGGNVANTFVALRN